MKCIYNQIISGEGKQAISFIITTKKGSVMGLYAPDKNRLFIHHAVCQNGLKGIMQVLINKFKTNLVTFSPLITDGIPNAVRGEIKTMPSNDSRNPYGEPIDYMECVWGSKPLTSATPTSNEGMELSFKVPSLHSDKLCGVRL